MSATAEGTYDWEVPGYSETVKTYYKVHGSLQSGQTPLVILHGGPGVPHQYLTALAALAPSTPVVFYDQLGCGRSTRLPTKQGDRQFWTVDLFLSELEGLLRHLGVQGGYDLYGHSWGGMLAAEHAIKRPAGLRRLVLADAPADAKACGEAVQALLAGMPQDVQGPIAAQVPGAAESAEYQKAITAFYNAHVCRLTPWPEEVQASMDAAGQDSTVYLTMWGQDEFCITGSLKAWSVAHDAHKIAAPTLLLNGRFDLAQDAAVAPFWRAIPRVRWATFAESAHMPHVEEKARLLELVREFLQ